MTLVVLFATIGLWAQTQPSVLDEVKIKTGKTIIVYSNGIWKERVFKKPTIEWVSIPAGTFTMGSPTSEAERYGDGEETQHQVTLSAFKMSKYEVTFEQYDLFCDATGRSKNNKSNII